MILNFLLTLVFLFSSSTTIGGQWDNPTANLSTSWVNTEYGPDLASFEDGSVIKYILPQAGYRFGCGFYCNGTCTSYLFAIIIFQISLYSAEPSTMSPQVVWSPNRDYPVMLGATLNLTESGELVLRDVDGVAVWITNTTGKSVAGLKLTNMGNLMLFDVNDSVVWQSFDYPTDCLVPGQKLYFGRTLTPSVSSTNWTRQGLYSLQVTDRGLSAYVESNPHQFYYQQLPRGTNRITERSYVHFLNGSLTLFISGGLNDVISVPLASSAQYLKFGSDGHLRVLEWQPGWTIVADLFSDFLGECDYPLACGRNGLCSSQKCSCPRSNFGEVDYFRPVNDRQPNLGCSEVTPLTCNDTQYQNFVALENVKYSTFRADIKDLDMEMCRQACLNNCSCKAALFRYSSNSSNGDCYLPSELFTMRKMDLNVTRYNTSAFVKVQHMPSSTHALSGKSNKLQRVRVFAFTIGSMVLLIIVVGFVVFIVQKRKRATEMEEDYLDQVPGMPTRFSYKELKAATESFSKKLGEGGFGSVFEGTLEDCSKIAVKCLEGLAQVKKSFIAEVQTIGSIHHVNLVRLRGLCAWKSQRFLVYEYMSNGSLDKWIYNENQEHVLEWKCRKKIILDIAKGLAYLHEDCRQKIIHFDIKPQNILLDEDFNAKVSDFGLSKLIDRNQSQVMTTMRGTPGYLAPEWLSSVITEKVDVYSFGIVLLEILCGRKNFDGSLIEENWNLLSVFQKSLEEGRLLDMVDKYSEDMQAHGVEVVEMMKVASWCLQYDFTRRPTMSSVIKVLEVEMDVESNLDYNFSNPEMRKSMVKHEADFTPLLPSILSGPR